jgi:hypothetical protein
MKYRMTQNLVSQSVSQSVSHGLVDSKSCVKNAVDIC